MKQLNQNRVIWDYLSILHLIYPLSIVILQIFIPDFYSGGDFLCFYNSVQNFYSDLSQLYVISEFAPFRYFPVSPTFYSYLILFNEVGGYIFTILLILAGNLILRTIVLKIGREIFGFSSEQINTLKKMIFVIFILPFNFDNYYNGQMATFSLIFLLISYYFFKKEEKMIMNNIIGSLFISCSILLKPFFIIILPFLLKIKIKRYKIKIELVTFFRYFFVLIFTLVNLFIFLLNLTLLSDFLEINSMYVFFESSQSFTNLLFLTGIEPEFIFFSTFIFLFSVLIIIYLFLGNEIDLFYYFGISIIIILITWPQAWPFYNLFLLFMLSLMSLKLREDKGLLSNFNTFWVYVLLNILNYIVTSILIILEIMGGVSHLHIISPISFLICFGYYIFSLKDRESLISRKMF